MDSNWRRNLCATGFVGTGEWGIPHVHTGGDTMFVVAAAVALLGLTLWAHRRFGTTTERTGSGPAPVPALARAVEPDDSEAGVVLDAPIREPDDGRTRELVDA